jgi:hypothetical protein
MAWLCDSLPEDVSRMPLPPPFDEFCHSQLKPTFMPLPMSSLPVKRQRVPDDSLSMNCTSEFWPSF